MRKIPRWFKIVVSTGLVMVACVGALVLVVWVTGYVETADVRQFKAQRGLGDSEAVDGFVTKQLTPDMSREQVHAQLETLGGVKVRKFGPNENRVGEFSELVDLRIGRLSTRSYVITYDANLMYKKIVSVS